jgi:hypothetical protein
MRKYLLIFFIGLMILTASNCRTNITDDKYKYIELSKYKIDSISLKPGTELRILAYSGGRNNDKDNINYLQFIVINKQTGDTLRILAPLISIDKSAGIDNLTYSPANAFDGPKGVYDAYYEPRDSTQNMMLNLVGTVNSSGTLDDNNAKDLSNPGKAKEWVAVNESIPIFENHSYKTTIGVLKFNKIPW